MGLPRVMTARRRGAFTLLVAIGFAQAAVSLGLVVIVREASNEAFAAAAATGMLALAALGLGFFLFALRIVQKRQGEALALGYTAEVRVNLVEQIFAMPAESSKTRLGLMMTRLITDLSAIKNWLAEGLASLFVALPSVSTIVVGAFFLAPSVAPYLLVGVVVWAAATVLAIPFLGRAIRESRKRRGRMSARLGDIVLARATLAHFGRGGPTVRRVERMSESLNAALVARAGWSGTARAASDLALPAIVASLMAIALTRMPAVAPRDLGILLLLSGLVVAQLADLARAADYRLAFREAWRRLSDILDQPVVGDPEDPVALPRAVGGRTLKVSFHTPGTCGERSFEAKAGAVVAVTGGAEADRSAFLRAIAEPSSRIDLAIQLDDIALSRVTRRDRRRAITLVSPSLPLIRASILDNIAIGAPSGTPHREIARIAHLAGLDLAANPDPAPLDPARVDPRLAGAIRAARALLRGAAVIAVDDPDLCRNASLLSAFVAEAAARRAVVVLAATADVARRADVVWDISGLALAPAVDEPGGNEGDEE